jgi:hypothetical protein
MILITTTITPAPCNTRNQQEKKYDEVITASSQVMDHVGI